MKLRNKRTGEIGYLITGKDSNNYLVCNDDWQTCGDYNSLAELNEEWEDAPGISKLYYTIDLIGNMPRDELLKKMAKYKRVYATGRAALEAKVLGCEILPYHPLFPDPALWKVLDNKDAAKILQKKLDEIDGVL